MPVFEDLIKRNAGVQAPGDWAVTYPYDPPMTTMEFIADVAKEHAQFLQEGLQAAGWSFYTFLSKKNINGEYPALRRIGSRVMFKLIAAFFSQMSNRYIHAESGAVVDVAASLYANSRDPKRSNYQVARNVLSDFVNMPEGPHTSAQHVKMQKAMQPLLPLLDLIEQLWECKIGFAQAVIHLDELTEKMQHPDFIDLFPSDMALQLTGGLKLFRLLIQDLTSLSLADQSEHNDEFYQAVSHSYLLSAMLPPGLVWLGDFFGELCDIAKRYREGLELAGENPGNVAKGWLIVSLLMTSRLREQFFAQLPEPLRAVQDRLFNEEAQAAALAEGASADRSVQASPWLSSLGAYGSLLQKLVTPPDNAMDSLTLAMQWLGTFEARNFLSYLFSQETVAPLVEPLSLLEDAPQRPAETDLNGQLQWSRQLFESTGVQTYLLKFLSVKDMNELREYVDWSWFTGQVAQLRARPDKDQAWYTQGLDMLKFLGQHLIALLRNHPRGVVKTTLKGVNLLAHWAGNTALIKAVTLGLLFEQYSQGMTWAKFMDMASTTVKAIIQAYTPALATTLWPVVTLAWRCLQREPSAELESWLELMVRHIKAETQATGAKALALDMLPLSPHLWQAFNGPGSDQPQVSIGERVNNAIEHLAESTSPTLKRMGEKMETALVSGLIGPLVAGGADSRPLFDNIGPSGAQAAPLQPVAPTVVRTIPQTESQIHLSAVKSAAWTSLTVGLVCAAILLHRRIKRPSADASLSAPNDAIGLLELSQTDAEASATTEMETVETRVENHALSDRSLGVGVVAGAVLAGIGFYHMRQAERLEKEQALREEPYTPLTEGANQTLQEGMIEYVSRTDPEALKNPEQLAAVIERLLQDSVSDTHARRVKRSLVQNPLYSDMQGSLDPEPIDPVSESSATQDVEQTDVPESKILLERHNDTWRIVDWDESRITSPMAANLQIRTLKRLPSEEANGAAVRYQYEIEANAQLANNLHAMAKNDLPSELMGLENFFEKEGREIHARCAMNTPFSLDEQIAIKYKTWQDNPLVFTTGLLGQIYRTFRYGVGNDDPLLVSADKSMSLSVRQLLSGHLYTILGQNAFDIELDKDRTAPDQRVKEAAYLEALRDDDTVSRYEARLQNEYKEPKVAKQFKNRLLSILNESIEQRGYRPEERLSISKATLHPAYVYYETWLKPGTHTSSRHWHARPLPILDLVRYIDYEKNIDLLVYLRSGTVDDIWSQAFKDKKVNRWESRQWMNETTHITVPGIERMAEILASVEKLSFAEEQAIASSIDDAERSRAAGLYDEQGRRLFDDVFLQRLKKHREKTLSSTPINEKALVPLRLYFDRKVDLDEFATSQAAASHAHLTDHGDRLTRNAREQTIDFWLHKVEFGLNMLATGAATLGAAPVALAGKAGVVAWMTAVLNASMSSLVRGMASDDSSQRRILFRNWVTTLASETMLLLFALYAVKPTATALTKTTTRLINFQPIIPPEMLRRHFPSGKLETALHDFYKYLNHPRHVELFQEAVEHALNSSLLSTGFWGYPQMFEDFPELKEAVESIDFSSILMPHESADAVQRSQRTLDKNGRPQPQLLRQPATGKAPSTGATSAAPSTAPAQGRAGRPDAWKRGPAGELIPVRECRVKDPVKNRWRIVDDQQANQPGEYIRLNDWTTYQYIWPKDDRAGDVYKLEDAHFDYWQATVNNPPRLYDSKEDLYFLKGTEIMSDRALDVIEQAGPKLKSHTAEVLENFDKLLKIAKELLDKQAKYLGQLKVGLEDDLNSVDFLADHQSIMDAYEDRLKVANGLHDRRYAPPGRVEKINALNRNLSGLMDSISAHLSSLGFLKNDPQSQADYLKNKNEVEKKLSKLKRDTEFTLQAIHALDTMPRPRWSQVIDDMVDDNTNKKRWRIDKINEYLALYSPALDPSLLE